GGDGRGDPGRGPRGGRARRPGGGARLSARTVSAGRFLLTAGAGNAAPLAAPARRSERPDRSAVVGPASAGGLAHAAAGEAATLQGGRPTAVGRRLGAGRTARRWRLRRGLEGTQSLFRWRAAGGAEVLPRPRGPRATAPAGGGDPQPRHAPGPPRRHRPVAAHLPVGRSALPRI